MERIFLPSFLGYALLGASFLGALTFIFQEKKELAQDIVYESAPVTFKSTPKEDRAWVEIYFGDARRRVFEGSMEGQTYPLALALESVAQAGKFTYRARDGRIEKIAGVGDTKGEWIVFRNQQRERRPISILSIAPGDRYTLRYEKK